MGTYIPNTKEEQLKMLNEIGYSDFDDLFKDIPEAARVQGELNLPKGKSEVEVSQIMEELASDNVVFDSVFRGAGAYNHYVPATVEAIANKEEFLTAYTPYQAEISQGVLQSIFEYQTMVCQLTDMDIANASMYDGASAAAEACAMTQDRKHSTIYVADTLDKRILSVINTYSFGRDAQVEIIPSKDGVTDLETLKSTLEADDKAACFLMQYPNFYGVVEDADAIAEIVHGAGAQLIMSVNPISLGVLKTPGEIGADVVVAEGQPLGLGLAYGGPYLGILATTQKNMRKIVGRLVGETKDSQGERGFVLTLQAREQHIRREKAASNICSNEALCALKASIYLATIGPKGLKQVATLCTSKAHYMAKRFEEIGMKLAYDKEFFHEFVTTCPNADQLLDALEDNGILGGLKLSDTEILWCCTELNAKEDIDDVIEIAKEVFSA
jgi:glycine dehydrogenase subunit 1